ncbi:YkyB-like protein [Streptohalobacillus salinus]|uniref:YkyB-like protein n=1 Tax=Streptohalobacillus salinus TaxID=621096 RepID=A0A2V3WD32_9BACI|nr:YkyB family protein [Streptohalobacillus salinus]PXW92650.1 YkyB-like protein [Streptohalobacillus salinus]
MEATSNELAKAIFIINRHAKTAPEPKELYQLKKQAIDKLIAEKRAKKIGLQFSEKPKLSRQHSTVLVKVGDFYFHIPPSKEDFNQIEHLGALDQNVRNPHVKMSLTQAKRMICKYLDISQQKDKNQRYSKTYTQSLLGRWNYSYYHKKK